MSCEEACFAWEELLQLSPYLHFTANARQRSNFTRSASAPKLNPCFPTKVRRPQHVPPEWRSKIMHARLIVGDQRLMGSDIPPDHYQKPHGFSLSLGIKDQAEAERIFQALRKWDRADAAPADILGGPIWYARR